MHVKNSASMTQIKSIWSAKDQLLSLVYFSIGNLIIYVINLLDFVLH